jgi:hypothetical protein
MPKTSTKPAFELVEVGTADEVPSWSRQPKKYDAIAEQVMKLEIGGRVAYRFTGKDEKDAKKNATKAVNTVRDALNGASGEARNEGGTPPVQGLVKTRVEVLPDGTVKGHIYMVEYPSTMSGGGSRQPETVQPIRRQRKK